MKQNLKQFTFMCLCLLGSMAGWAAGVVTPPGVGSYLHIGGIAYKVTSSDPRTVTVTNKYNTLTQSGVQKTYTGVVVIPETITYSDEFGSWTYSVTGIDDNAFQYSSAMTALTIPNTVTSVSSSAFTNATGLASLTISDGTGGITLSLPNSPLTTLYLGRNFYSSYGALKGATNLTITKAGHVTTLSDGLFYGSSTLKKVILPEGLTTIPQSTFNGCTALTSVNIPQTVTEIGYYAFEDCSSLKTISIPASVGTIKISAFYGCTSLKTLVIEDGDTYIDMDRGSTSSSPFDENCSIDSLYLGRRITGFATGRFKNLTKVAIGDKVTYLYESLFSGCSKLTNVHFGKNVTSMGTNVFSYCSSLESMDLCSNLETIPQSTFKGCTALTSVNIPQTVTEIGHYAFEDCSSLKTISIPASVGTIGSSAFSKCTNLKTLIIEDGEESLTLTDQFDNSAFSDNCAIESLYLGRNLTYATLKWANLTKVEIGDKVTNVNSGLFSYSPKLTSVHFGKNIETMGSSAFSGCKVLESIGRSSILPWMATV